MSSQWGPNGEQVREVGAEVERLAAKEEVYWRQRSIISWLRDGDRNTKYFHVKATQRRRQNTITGLVSSHGDWCSDNNGISEIVMDYFENLFTTSSPSEFEIWSVLETMEPKVDEPINLSLCAPFSVMEVKFALFDMNPDRAPGPDGLSTLFYQEFWDVVGEDVTEAVLRVLKKGPSLEDWNDTIVNLISKVQNPMLLKYFQPISLYIEVTGPIKPSRVLRQDDPLSSYLFVLCAHGLSTLFNVYEAMRLFRGAKITPTSPSVSHLFFADDSMVFFRASMEVGEKVNECLVTYEKASVQKHDLYLGMPTVSLRSKELQFKYLVERVGKRIQGWSSNCFSVRGK
ncbi:uncharacterized protein [Henckelia pumila]|uniref:uncharacterized protein n=1 Tax=Henckelia pumila TaxID=405737 RepID=UPI003C6E7D29